MARPLTTVTQGTWRCPSQAQPKGVPSGQICLTHVRSHRATSWNLWGLVQARQMVLILDWTGYACLQGRQVSLDRPPRLTEPLPFLVCIVGQRGRGDSPRAGACARRRTQRGSVLLGLSKSSHARRACWAPHTGVSPAGPASLLIMERSDQIVIVDGTLVAAEKPTASH